MLLVPLALRRLERPLGGVGSWCGYEEQATWWTHNFGMEPLEFIFLEAMPEHILEEEVEGQVEPGQLDRDLMDDEIV